MHHVRRAATACALGILTTLAPVPAGASPEPVALTMAPLPPLPPLPATPNSLLIREALASANKYLLNTWWAQRMSPLAPYGTFSRLLLTKYTVNDEEIRRYSSAALSIAAALATGAYDEKVTGVPAATARERVIELVALGVRTHKGVAGSYYGRALVPLWGAHWQSALWASQFALAGWLMGDALQEPERGMVARMLEFEAECVYTRALEVLRDKNGKIVRPGNSGADEVAWDAVAIYTAVELLPRHGRRGVWAHDAYRRFLGSYALPSDVKSPVRVHGKALSKWITGSNLEPTGWVVNHGKLNPDYTVGFTPHAVVVSGLANVGYPNAIRHNQALLYRNVAEYSWPSPPHKAPGGTVYVPGRPDVYYPRGVDWGSHRQVMFGTWDVEAAALGLDAGLRTPATTWARLHLQEVRRMQQRFTTGQLHGGQNEDKYFAREEHAGALLAYAHLVDVLAHGKRLRPDDQPSEKTKRPWGMDR